MECSQARELISRRCEGRLPLDQEQALARHLAHCEPCRRVGASLVQVEALLDAAPRVVVPANLSGMVLATVRRRARRERAVRNALIAALSVLLVVVAVVLPAMRVAEATNGGSALALALGQVGAQALDLTQAVVAPVVTIARAVLLGEGYPYAIAWLLVAVMLVIAWAGVVSRAIRPAQQDGELTTAVETAALTAAEVASQPLRRAERS